MSSIRPVTTAEEIQSLCRLAQRIWNQHYVPIIGQAQVDYMLEKFQSPEAVTEQIADGYEYYVILQAEDAIGYVALQPQRAERSALLSKIYVRADSRACGCGKKLLSHVEQRCRQLGIRNLWLTVNKRNRDSIDWYERAGFRKTGPLVTDIGAGFVMDDFRMEKELDLLNGEEPVEDRG